MPEELRISSRPSLERPTLIAAFRGWNDGGQGASLAAGYLAKLWGAERFAEVDPENFFDFQATRPHVTLEEGVTRRLDWPATVFYHGRPPGLDHDVVLLTDIVAGYAKELRTELVVTLGALLADVPHTRSCPVTGTASDEQLVERLGLSASRYEGPTGVVGVLHDACRRLDLPSVSLWAAVPHYVSLTPSPRAALALCERLGDLLGTRIDTEELEEASAAYVDQVSEAVSSDPDTATYVEELEARADEISEENVPSGEALAAELTRFLRDRDRENGEPDFASDQ